MRESFYVCCLALCLYPIVVGAPAPKAKPKPPPQVTPGRYRMQWGTASCVYDACLARGGRYATRCGWYGTWDWDSHSRTLTIQETHGSRYSLYRFVMGEGMHGVGRCYGEHGEGRTDYQIPIKLERNHEPQ